MGESRCGLRAKGDAAPTSLPWAMGGRCNECCCRREISIWRLTTELPVMLNKVAMRCALRALLGVRSNKAKEPGIMVQRSGSQGITERRTGGGSLGMQRELIARLLSKRNHQDPTRPLDLSEGGGRIMNLEGNKTL